MGYSFTALKLYVVFLHEIKNKLFTHYFHKDSLLA